MPNAHQTLAATVCLMNRTEPVAEADVHAAGVAAQGSVGRGASVVVGVGAESLEFGGMV